MAWSRLARVGNEWSVFTGFRSMEADVGILINRCKE